MAETSTLNERQAFLAMYLFIERYWFELAQPTEISILLSEIGLAQNEQVTIDPASWETWLDCVRFVYEDQPRIEAIAGSPMPPDEIWAWYRTWNPGWPERNPRSPKAGLWKRLFGRPADA